MPAGKTCHRQPRKGNYIAHEKINALNITQKAQAGKTVEELLLD
jgi:hypothetical protein